MNSTENRQGLPLNLPTRTVTQLDELIREGRFTDHQTAIVTAVERLYAEARSSSTARQQAVDRLCGALRLGTSPESLRKAEQERLDWESGQG